MKSSPHNSNTSHSKTNDRHIRRHKRFLKKNKLDNALVVSDSGEVIDLYAETIVNGDIGFMSSIRMQFFCWLSEGFYCAGGIFVKAGSMASLWRRCCYMLSGGSSFIGFLMYRAGGERSMYRQDERSVIK